MSGLGEGKIDKGERTAENDRPDTQEIPAATAELDASDSPHVVLIQEDVI